jgi:hypothetical protein
MIYIFHLSQYRCTIFCNNLTSTCNVLNNWLIMTQIRFLFYSWLLIICRSNWSGYTFNYNISNIRLLNRFCLAPFRLCWLFYLINCLYFLLTLDDMIMKTVLFLRVQKHFFKTCLWSSWSWSTGLSIYPRGYFAFTYLNLAYVVLIFLWVFWYFWSQIWGKFIYWCLNWTAILL